MPRYKQDHRDKTYEAIVEAASQLLRDRGFAATSVAEVMGAVGLTPGGFYAHFPDKTAMLVAALERAFVESPRNFSALASMANTCGDPGFIAEKYLMDARVQDIAVGCPAAALGSEVHRQPQAVQAAFQSRAEESAREIAKTAGLEQPKGEAAWAALALLSGALSLMRAVPDTKVRATIRSQVVECLRRMARKPDVSPAAQARAVRRSPKMPGT